MCACVSPVAQSLSHVCLLSPKGLELGCHGDGTQVLQWLLRHLWCHPGTRRGNCPALHYPLHEKLLNFHHKIIRTRIFRSRYASQRQVDYSIRNNESIMRPRAVTRFPGRWIQQWQTTNNGRVQPCIQGPLWSIHHCAGCWWQSKTGHLNQDKRFEDTEKQAFRSNTVK